jgi:hypothetical protein
MLQQCEFVNDRFVPSLEKHNLRVLHHGGDYGNFIAYVVEWLTGSTDNDIQQVITETGSAHGHPVCYLHRYGVENNKMSYEFLGRCASNFSAVRLHWLFPVYKDAALEVQLLSQQGPTVVVDYSECILEITNNRKHKMPVPFELDLETVILKHQHFALICRQIESCPNVFVFKMKQLNIDPIKEFRRLMTFLKIRVVRSNSEFVNMLQYWQSSQPFLGRDQQVQEWLRASPDSIDPRINDIEKQLIAAFPKYDYKFLK